MKPLLPDHFSRPIQLPNGALGDVAKAAPSTIKYPDPSKTYIPEFPPSPDEVVSILRELGGQPAAGQPIQQALEAASKMVESW